MNKIAGGLVLLVLCLFFGSCHLFRLGGSKKAGTTDSLVKAQDSMRTHFRPLPDDTTHPVVTVAPHQSFDAVTSLWKRRISYKTFSGKAKMHFEGPDQKVEFTAHIRLQKDSRIWVYITALGGVVPVARILVTPDSFFMVNYQEQEVTKISLEKIGKVLPTKVDFAALQNFIVGDPMRDGDITGVAVSGDTLSLHVEDTAYVQQISYNKNDSLMFASDMTTRKPGGPKADTKYNAYATIDGRKISTFRTLNIRKDTSDYSIDMNFQRIDFDQPVDFPFSIPSDYTVKQ